MNGKQKPKRTFGFAGARVSRPIGKAGLMDGAPYGGGGTKHISLVLTEAGWRIVSVAWEDERG